MSRAFYDFYAKNAATSHVSRLGSLNLHRYQRRICRTLAELRPAPALLLEIGPGVGHLAAHCSELNYSYVGLDGNSTLLASLAAKYPVVQCMAPPLPLRSSCLDVIVADQVIEHMPTFREALHFLSECRRALRPLGLVAIGFPDYARMTGMAFYDGDYSHSFLTTTNRIEQVLSDAGFELVKVLRFSGSLSNSIVRPLIDIGMLVLYAKLLCLLADAVGLGPLLFRLRKTLLASTVIFAAKSA